MLPTHLRPSRRRERGEVGMDAEDRDLVAKVAAIMANLKQRYTHAFS